MHVSARLQALRAEIDAAATLSGRAHSGTIALGAIPADRAPASVRLIGVAKTRTPAEVVEAVAAGLTDVGENYLDESLPVIAAVAAAGLACTWHFIGHLQGNKTRAVATHFDWVHTVDRARIADRLSAQRDPAGPPLQVLIQTNFDREPSKSGVTDDAEMLALAHAIQALPNLDLRGLMTIPPADADPAPAFARTRAALMALQADFVQRHGPRAASALDTLSMGMSDDFAVAIAEGSTMVRIGTALFGPRPPKPARDIPPSQAAPEQHR